MMMIVIVIINLEKRKVRSCLKNPETVRVGQGP